jgi:hypothetical protein
MSETSTHVILLPSTGVVTFINAAANTRKATQMADHDRRVLLHTAVPNGLTPEQLAPLYLDALQVDDYRAILRVLRRDTAKAVRENYAAHYAAMASVHDGEGWYSLHQAVQAAQTVEDLDAAFIAAAV